jgi:outer membrane protein TolC
MKLNKTRKNGLKAACLLGSQYVGRWFAILSISFLSSSLMAQVVATPPAAAQLQPLTALFQSTDFSAMVRSYRVDDTLGAGPPHAVESGFKTQVREAVVRHPTFRSAQAQGERSKFAIAELEGALWPQVSAGLAGESPIRRRAGAQSASSLNSNAYLGVNQLIYDGGAQHRRIDAGQMRAKADLTASQISAEALILRAVRAYAEVTALAHKVRLAELNVQRHQALLDMVNQLVTGQVSSRADLLRAQGRYVQVQVALFDLRGELGRAQAAWREFYGTQPAPLLPLPLRAEQWADSQKWLAQFAERNLELQRLRQVVSAAREDLAAEKSTRGPKLAMQLNTRQYQLNSMSSRDFEIAAGMQLTYPVFDGGVIDARVNQVAQRLSQAELDLDAALGVSDRNLRTQFSKSASQRQSVKALELFLQAGEAAMSTYVEQFAIGRRPLVDLLDAQRELVASANSLIDARVELDQSHFTVAQGLGELLSYFDFNF